jgi:alpha-beta hydrolase superfamily lysophospholipase
LAEVPFLIGTHIAGDGYVASYRRYPARGMTRGRVVYLHGVQSHAGWYEYSCTRLAEAGFEVLFPDRRGSGMNKARRGDTPSFRRLLDDIAEFAKPIPGSATVLVAVSWGGKLATALASLHPEWFKGLALLCPGYFPRLHPPFLERLAIAVSRFTRPTGRFAIPLNDPELFTSTPRWLDFLRNDAPGLRQATARFMMQSFRLDRFLRTVPARVTTPLLLMLAEHDRIIDNAKTRNFVEQFATTDRTIIEYAGAHHTLEFEPEPGRFVDDLIAWLESRGR